MFILYRVCQTHTRSKTVKNYSVKNRKTVKTKINENETKTICKNETNTFEKIMKSIGKILKIGTSL